MQPIQTSNLPLFSQKVYGLCNILERRSDPSDKRTASEIRRIREVALNCGTSIPLLSGLRFLMRDNELATLSVDYFDRTAINWKSIEVESFDYASAFALPSSALEKDLLHNSSEACLTQLLWNEIFHISFRKGLELPGQTPYYRITPQWNAFRFINGNKNRFVDWAVVTGLCSSIRNEFPIFMIEAGTERIPDSLLQKDFPKMSCLMSAACMDLAYQLIAAGKKPEIARVYGLLVGGTQARLMVASTVVKLESGLYQIHVNISGNSDWTINLLDEAPLPKAYPTDNPLLCEFFETSLSAAREFPALNIINILKAFTTTVGSRNRPKDPTPYNQFISSPALKKCMFITQMVKARIALIQSDDPSNFDRTGRRFMDKPPLGPAPTSLSYSSAITPLANRIRTQIPAPEDIDVPQTTPTRPVRQAIVLTKQINDIEIEATSYLSYYLKPHFAHKYWSTEDVNTNTVKYCFEKLEPLTDDDGGLSAGIISRDPLQFIIDYTKFFLDCSFNLYLLHSQARLVHSDIAPNNIMYSLRDSMWKIIDYNHAMSLDESLFTKRTAGTSGYIAPEALETGIFTPESDIWSLGTVIDVYFFRLAAFIASDSELFENASTDLFRLICSMIQDDPAERAKLPEIIRTAYEILCMVDPAHQTHPGDKIIKAVKNAIELWDKEAEKKRQESVCLEPKRGARSPLPPLSPVKVPLFSDPAISIELAVSDEEKGSGQSL